MNADAAGLTWPIWLQAGFLALLLLGIVNLYWRKQRGVRASARIAASEARLKLNLWASGDELWTVDLATGEVQRENPIPGLRINEPGFGESLAAITRAVHPDDLSAFSEALDQHLRGQRDMFEAVFSLTRVR